MKIIIPLANYRRSFTNKMSLIINSEKDIIDCSNKAICRTSMKCLKELILSTITTLTTTILHLIIPIIMWEGGTRCLEKGIEYLKY
jgi:hypothetical protein